MTADKDLCTFGRVTFQDRIDVAIQRAGGQSELARKVKQRYPDSKITPQVVQYLASRTPKKGKLARGSMYSAQIAAAVGLNADWLSNEKGPMDVGARLEAREPEAPSEDVTVELFGMRLSKEAVQLAAAWMELPGNKRAEFKRKVETLALQYRDFVPDEKLGRLSAKDKLQRAAVAKQAKPAAKKKTRAPGTH